MLHLIIGLLLTFFSWRYSQQQQTQHLNKEFKFATEQVAKNIHSRIAAYEIMLRGVRAYFHGSNDVTFAEFKNYVNDLHLDNKKSGIQGVAIVALIPHKDKTQHINHLRRWQLKDYQIKPAGDRAFYAPIVSIEPMVGDNLKAMGLDLLTRPAELSAMEKSRDLDMATISAPIMLVQDAGKPDSLAFVMYLPIFANNLAINTITERRAAIKSWVDVPFRINDLINGLSGEIPADIVLEIYDGVSISDQFRMYQSSNHLQNTTIQSNFPPLSKRLDIGGRSWTIVTTITPAFVERVANPRQSLIIALAGLSLSLMLAWLSLILVSGRQKAQTRYKQLFAQAGEGVIILDSNHHIIDCNRAALNLFGYSNIQFLSLSLHQILEKSEINQLDNFIDKLKLNLSVSALKEWSCVRQDGSPFTAEISCSRLDVDNYFMIVRDLTDRKKAELQIQRLNKLYLALSETNQAIVRKGDENELLTLVCKCAVEQGDMKMAWIGKFDTTSANIMPIASYGAAADCLAILKAVNDDNATRVALKEHKPIIINDLLNHLDASDLHRKAKKLGWRSAASFPIYRHAQPYALLTVYHEETQAFDKIAVDLLTEMAGDISFALDNFDREQHRLQSQKMLAESEAKLSTILNNVAAYIYVKDLKGRYLFANQLLLNLWNSSSEEVIGFGDEKFFDATTTHQIRGIDQKVLVKGEVVEKEEANQLKGTGETRIYWSVKLPLRRADGSIYGLCGISTDMTEQKRTEADLKLAAISFESQLGMIIMDAQKVVLKVNKAYTKISNFSAGEVVGKKPELISAEHDMGIEEKIWREAANQGGWEGEVWSKRKNGEVYPQYLIVTAVKDAQQHIINYVASLTDITESKAAASEIEQLAFYDILTQLPNRRLLLDRLSHALTISQRSGLVGGLLYLDLDQFKIVNDSRGHDIGDLLLKQVAARLIDCVRADDTVARLGGDEYVILLEGLSKEPLEAAAQTEIVAQKIQIALSKPYQLATHQASATASIGLVFLAD